MLPRRRTCLEPQSRESEDPSSSLRPNISLPVRQKTVTLFRAREHLPLRVVKKTLPPPVHIVSQQQGSRSRSRCTRWWRKRRTPIERHTKPTPQLKCINACSRLRCMNAARWQRRTGTEDPPRFVKKTGRETTAAPSADTPEVGNGILQARRHDNSRTPDAELLRFEGERRPRTSMRREATKERHPVRGIPSALLHGERKQFSVLLSFQSFSIQIAHVLRPFTDC